MRRFTRQWVLTEGMTLKEILMQFWMSREAGVSMDCAILVGKEKISRVAEAKFAVLGICMRLSC